MTLNIAATTRHAVFLTGDFRLSRGSRREDDTTVQKIVPVVKKGWCALVAYSGIGRFNSFDVGRWIAEQSRFGDTGESLSDYLERLRSADRWLSRVPSESRWLTICVVGFRGRDPFVQVISNAHNRDGVRSDKRLAALETFKAKARKAEVRLFGSGANRIERAEMDGLRELLAQNKPDAMLHALSIINANIASRDDTVSRECVVGYIDASGSGRVAPCGIEETDHYLPDFVVRSLKDNGFVGFKPKFDEDGAELPPLWRGMTFKRQGTPGKDSVTAVIHVFRNVAEGLVGELQAGTTFFQQTACGNEPTAYTFKVGEKEFNVRSSIATSALD
jgi:hypothetical protein